MRKLLFILFIFILEIPVFSNEYSRLLGKWIIESKIPVSGTVYSMNSFECLGKVLVFKENSVCYENIEYQITEINEELLDSDLLYNATKGIDSIGVTFEDLGIKAKKVVSIDIKIMHSVIPGEWILITGEDHIIVFYLGYYFTATKVEDR